MALIAILAVCIIFHVIKFEQRKTPNQLKSEQIAQKRLNNNM
jgi:hypothetical protein